tara:strand:+ start:1326 stop:3209 length:1884 start_codon:yes stop_codon:yes gene_type:complete
MCGILGFYNKDKNKIFSKELFGTLLNTIQHRGPDSNGTYQNKNFIFGMNRLSIIDQKNGDQPISSENGDYKIIFNGEIYNYKELKLELERSNVKFKSDSDTEVVLNLYIKYGEKFLNKLNGMFAFAIYRVSTNEVFLARDRFGKKPLYYYNSEESFIFSSELTPILRSNITNFKLNFQSIIDYMSLWYVSEPKTIIKNIFQLKPGHFLKLKDGNMFMKKWWQINFNDSKLNFKEAAEKLEYLIEDSVKIRLTSDVKVVSMLSGGIDSGIISNFYKKNYSDCEAFILDFKEKTYSEYELGKLTSNKLNLKLNKVNYINSKNQIINILEQIDEPLGNASLIASYQIFNFINQKKIKVVLTGDGGDELFGGYPTYQSVYYNKIFKSVPKPIFNSLKFMVNLLPVSKNRISFDYRIKKLLKYIKEDPLFAHPRWREPISISEYPNLLNKVDGDLDSYDPFQSYYESYSTANSLDKKNKMMFADFQNYLLNDHLRKIDRCSMLNSVEARCPFLDHRIVNFAFSINSSYKVNFFNLKKILKHIGHKFLDKRNINSSKKGLTPPINYWIEDYFKDYLYDNLNNRNNPLFQLLNKNSLEEILNQHFKKKKDYSRFIWSIISMSLWLEKNKKFISV